MHFVKENSLATYGSKPGLWRQLEDFAQRQPELFLIGALASGFLLGYWMKGPRGRTDFANRPDRVHGNPTDASASMPSARLGATEDQIARSMQQSAASAVSKDDVSTTGTAYELDPKSITAG